MTSERRLWNKTLGDVGEELVSCYLSRIGWQILSRKYHVGRSPEVDLIARTPEGILVFIEVKTRTISSSQIGYEWYESAAQCINARKRTRIMCAARQFRIETGEQYSQCRFDLVVLGLSLKLASDFFQLALNGLEENLLNVLDYQISEYLSGRAQEHLNIIHTEAAF